MIFRINIHPQYLLSKLIYVHSYHSKQLSCVVCGQSNKLTCTNFSLFSVLGPMKLVCLLFMFMLLALHYVRKDFNFNQKF